MFENTFVVVRGAGDLATGVIHRLVRSGFPVIATDIDNPTVIRRTVAFAEAIWQREATVEGMTARRADSPDQALQICQEGMVPIIADPEAGITERLNPFALVDAILAKKNLGTRRGMAEVVVGLGPGFSAGEDVDVVIETNRGHDPRPIDPRGYGRAQYRCAGQRGRKKPMNGCSAPPAKASSEAFAELETRFRPDRRWPRSMACRS